MAFGQYRGTPNTYTDLDTVDNALVDVNGNLCVNLASGSINTTVGTIDVLSAGTVTNLLGGTVNTLKSGTIDTLKLGTVNVTTGTIASVTNLAAGTVTALANGTITAGTINSVANLAAGSIIVTNGTIASLAIGTIKPDGRAARNILTFGTTFGAAGTAYGTLVGSAAVGVGTSIYINDLSIVNSKGGTVLCSVGFGTALNGTSVLAKGDFGPQGGIQKSYPLAVNAGMTNQDLTCYIGAAGTIDVNVSYFISV